MGGVAQESKAMAAEDQQHPLHHGMSAGEYLRSRISSLKPPLLEAPSPIRLLRSVNRTQWAFFMVAFAAWVCLPLLYLFGLLPWTKKEKRKRKKKESRENELIN